MNQLSETIYQAADQLGAAVHMSRVRGAVRGGCQIESIAWRLAEENEQLRAERDEAREAARWLYRVAHPVLMQQAGVDPTRRWEWLTSR